MWKPCGNRRFNEYFELTENGNNIKIKKSGYYRFYALVSANIGNVKGAYTSLRDAQGWKGKGCYFRTWLAPQENSRSTGLILMSHRIDKGKEMLVAYHSRIKSVSTGSNQTRMEIEYLGA